MVELKHRVHLRLAALVDFAAYQPCANIRLFGVSLVRHDPPRPHQDVVWDSLHVIQCINFKDMSVKVVEFIDHCCLYQIVTQRFAGVLICVAGSRSVVIYIQISTTPFLDRRCLGLIGGCDALGELDRVVADRI